jgi:RND family efflux transporter MFP subunit
LHEAEIRLRAATEALAAYEGAFVGGKVAVRAPIAGVIANRMATPGSRVEAGASLFSIVDPSVAWLTVNVPAAQAAQIGRGTEAGASFRVEGSRALYDTRRTVSIGSVLDATSRTLPVIYEVVNPSGAIPVGAAAIASVRTGVPVRGVLVPASAVLEEDGRPVVFVQLDGESFERRAVQLGARRGERVLLVDGVVAGERIVTGAAYQIRLASLSTAVPAIAHEH